MSRWKMNRIGFVNFWLYDEEEFQFENGRLLLRGQNGSGKSITTQSFIPFILDGDRTPSRLDPFGSSDRRMEYYFLGEEGKEESTGYLFLEFKKEEEETYRTIGIGQRARRGKPMDFWGFLILDGRRIGYDLWLYRETGSVKIPLDKRELKQLLGEDNLFTDSPGEYKKLVNQYIFGFRKLEQYDQFIRLLVKVRAPKLSKEFRPSKVYDILNDSLQTLTDEDLRIMVDAMEKMDEIQESLDTLERAFEDVKIIRTEYTRYNQYMLAKKGQAYLEGNRKVKESRGRLDTLTARKQETGELIREKEQELFQQERQEKIYLAEKEGLLDTDLEETAGRLEEKRRIFQDLQSQEQRWQRQAEECNSRIFQAEQKLGELQEAMDGQRKELEERKQELEEQQEYLRWEEHQTAAKILSLEQTGEMDRISAHLAGYRNQLNECRRMIRLYEEALRVYDEVSRLLEERERERKEREREQEQAQEQAEDCRENWITAVFQAEKSALAWKPEHSALLEAEKLVQDYRDMSDGGAIQELLRQDYERQRQNLLDERGKKQLWRQEKQEEMEQTLRELAALTAREELEPERDEQTLRSREALARAGIHAVPFYKTVEFSPGLAEAECARLEAQLWRMGLLDALVAAREDIPRIRRDCPEFLDSLILVEQEGSVPFPGLQVSEELEDGIRREVLRILKSIGADTGQEKSDAASIQKPAAAAGKDGSFRHGLLAGMAGKEGEAEFVGRLARQRKKERQIRSLKEQIREEENCLKMVGEEIEKLEKTLKTMEEEYRGLPDFSELNEAIQEVHKCAVELEIARRNAAEQEKKEREAAGLKDDCYQKMLRQCRPFPYGRTEEEYGEACDVLTEYEAIWQSCRMLLLQLSGSRERIASQTGQIEREKELLDQALSDRQRCSVEKSACEAQIRQMEAYLDRPEIREKAKRLQMLNEELETIKKNCENLRIDAGILRKQLTDLEQEEPERKEAVIRAIGEETVLRDCFEEELSLKLLMSREALSLEECAKKAQSMLREGDRNREASEMLQALYQVFQRHNGNLSRYGTALEECFGTETGEGPDAPAGVLRKRVLVTSVWNGKKVWLEEFYKILKNAIDETRLLIQQKDRELFEDILSQTISQQMTDRIAESRKWVADMSKLMREMDTSMGLTFSLEWRPKKAENDAELDVTELEQILLRDRELLTVEDIEKAASHFRSKIRTEKRIRQESGGMINYMDLVREAMDYRGWFEFQMYYRRGEEPRKPLTNAAFNRFSGGEKAMAMYVPLFAAVSAQYQKTSGSDYPRIIALDEAFAGVDDKNISSMFQLVHKLDFDYIMNSQSLWGCYETVTGLRIAELLRPMNSRIVTVIRYTWNGHERVLEEQ